MLTEELSKVIWRKISAMELGNSSSLMVQFYLATGARLTMLMELKKVKFLIDEKFESQ